MDAEMRRRARSTRPRWELGAPPGQDSWRSTGVSAWVLAVGLLMAFIWGSVIVNVGYDQVSLGRLIDTADNAGDPADAGDPGNSASSGDPASPGGTSGARGTGYLEVPFDPGEDVSGPADGILPFFFWVSGVPLIVMGLVAAFHLMRLAPDLFIRREVQAAVVRVERRLVEVVEEDEQAVHGFVYRLEVQDDVSAEVQHFDVGSERLRTAGGNIANHLIPGDRVRLVVGARQRLLKSVEAVADSRGQPLAPWGRAAETPEGAPVATSRFMSIVRASLPHIDVTDVESQGVPVRVWTYRFDDTARVVVYLARGDRGEEAIREYAAPGASGEELLTPPPEQAPAPRSTLRRAFREAFAPPPTRSRLGPRAYRLRGAGLLMVPPTVLHTPGNVTIAVQRAGTWLRLPDRKLLFGRTKRPASQPYPIRRWDEDLAEAIRDHLRGPAAGLPPRPVDPHK